MSLLRTTDVKKHLAPTARRLLAIPLLASYPTIAEEKLKKNNFWHTTLTLAAEPVDPPTFKSVVEKIED